LYPPSPVVPFDSCFGLIGLNVTAGPERVAFIFSEDRKKSARAFVQLTLLKYWFLVKHV
jgi:hypothetical protein